MCFYIGGLFVDRENSSERLEASMEWLCWQLSVFYFGIKRLFLDHCVMKWLVKMYGVY